MESLSITQAGLSLSQLGWFSSLSTVFFLSQALLFHFMMVAAAPEFTVSQLHCCASSAFRYLNWPNFNSINFEGHWEGIG